jgi:broad specificity phosphatase PhoE
MNTSFLFNLSIMVLFLCNKAAGFVSPSSYLTRMTFLVGGAQDDYHVHSKSLSQWVTFSHPSKTSLKRDMQTTSDGIYIVHSMPEPLPPKLKHDYFLLRHGQSTGNVEGVISSARSLATSTKHGLTPLGMDQGTEAAGRFLALLEQQVQKNGDCMLKLPNKRVFFYSSPFARAKQTAEACLNALLTKEEHIVQSQQLNLDIQKDIRIEDGLMERFFGELDDKPLATYAYVWPEDQLDVTQTGTYNVESVAAVATRAREVIMKIEESQVHSEEGDVIVLTSHADVCQIIQLYASGIENVGDFSSYRFANGEVRYMGRSVDTLPERQPLEMPGVLPKV